MFKLATPMFIEVLTSLHAGSGQELGIVDLPIQRERHTNFPKIESSTLKGCIREAFEELKDKDPHFPVNIHLCFGYDEDGVITDEVKKVFESKEQKQFTGCIGFTDARILFFPVKSVKGVFAYVTCKSVLDRFVEDIQLCKDNIKKN